ncbi:hypothetical protein N2603_36625 [Bradyrhizobium huanghuaihaiense]|uniref:hypothetical protein n=1 Tax=Bradyrhizobium huanghuaihaiense TaxID=990078 RepID=UPI0021A9D6BF|nr:hypothetical protein [Bradyrhizobium sp. CB3035]UWU75494.1 hypothetical protein N2603_36625 [Bradyrhizobium sp. CB3035]
MLAPPGTRSRREGGNPCTGEYRNLEVQQPETAISSRRAQRLQRMFGLSLSMAAAIAELAFAGLPR